MNKLFSLLVLNLIFIFASQAQLTQLTNQNLESCSEVRQMLKKGNLIFSKGRTGGIHKSNDTGTSWTYSAHGLDTFTNKIKDLIVFNNDLYVLMDNSRTENPVYKSSDNGVTWQYLGTSVTGLPSRPFNICSIGSANNKAFMIINIHDFYGYGHDSSYIYYSNNATNWNQGAFIGTGWGIEFIHNLSNSKMYFASNFNNVDSLMFTMDGNTIHGIPTTGIDRNEFRAYDVSGEPNGNTLYSIYNSSPYKFDSSTQTWNNIRTASIPANVAFDLIKSTDHLVFGFAFILPAFTAAYYRSIDHGNTWTQITDTSIIPPAFLCEISDSQYIIPTQLGEIFYSSNHGASWTKKGNGYQNLSTTSITEVNNTLLVKKDIYGILRSTDKGQTWAYSNTGLSQVFWGLLFANSLFSHNNIAYTTIQPSMDSDTLHFCKSTNSGQSWTRLTNIPNYQRMKYAGESGNTLFMKFVDNDNDGNHDWDTACFFYKTTNAGDSWTLISQNFFTTTLNLKRVNGIFGDGSILYLFATTKDDKEVVCKSTNNGLTWTTIVFNHNIDRRLKTKYSRDNELELPIIDFDDNNMPLFVLTNNNQNPYFDSLFTISANHVVPLNTIGLPSNMSAFELKFNKGYWYISTTVGIYVSRDGINWYKEATTPYYLGMITLKMQFVEDDIFLGTFGNGVWKYTHKKVDAGADIYYCKGDSVTLTATAPDLNFTWCCGLGTNKSVTIAPTGINNYVASATDIFGLTTYDTVAVIEYPLPNLKFSIDDTIQCLSGNKINIVNNSSGAVSYVWKFGDGTTSTTFHPSHSYSFYQDTFEITLIGTTGKGCIDSIKHYVFFNEQPVVSIYAAGDTSVCQGDSVTMYANTGTNISYQWYKNNIAINGANQPFYVAIQSGNYSVEITNNISGCSNKSKSIEITIYQTNYNPNFTASPRNPTWSVAQQQFNLVAFTNLTLNPSNFNFTWLLGDQNTSNQSDPFYNYKFNGLYSVSLIAQHINTGCQDTFTREDYIMCQGGSANPCPITVNITYSGSPLICKNDSFLITATTTGNNLNYIWTHEGTVLTQEDTSFVYAKKSGRYQVIVSDPNCSVTSLPFYLNHYPMLEPIIYGEGNIRPCTNDSMKLFVTTYYKDYYWSTGDSGKFIYTHNSGDYTITVTGVHNCKITSQPFTVNASLLNAPEICIVTVDSATKKNVVAWERPSSNIIIGYNIYKETYQANIYQLIGYRPYDSLSVFVDTNSKPRQWSSRYKITLIDTCNTESPPSPHHKTIHLLANSGTSGENNLIWSHYEGFNFSSYKIYRGTSPSNMVLLDSIPSNLNSYSDLTPPTGLVFYQVSVIAPDTCSPSVFRGQTTSGPFSHSLSNLKDYNREKKDYLSVSNDTINFDSTGGIILLDVFTTLASWSSVSDETWLSINDDISNARISLTAQAFSGPGVRNATVTVSGNSVDDFIIKVIQSSVVGIKENIQNNNILIYPNPFNNFFYVYFEETMEVSQIELIDISGKIIQTFKSPKDNLLKINRNEISKGMYFLRITSDKVFVAKIIAN